MGTATAAIIEGNNTNSNWYHWENQFDENNKPRIRNGEKSDSADHWNRYSDDIRLMTDLGTSHYRFSVEWSKIEPENGKFNKKQSNTIEIYVIPIEK